MYICCKSFTLFGINAVPVNVEVSITPGLAKFEIIGLPDASIRESKERIFQSLQACGYEIPPGNVTVNLAPAELRKKGALFDLPIALGMAMAAGYVKSSLETQSVMMAGELSLTGIVLPVSGIFNAAYTCSKKNIGIL
ncbi:MAG TPA: hypothetical protein DC049_11340, partial [Spirochaetia bacterium]|nr:hypothetical protein [Spirochaetia bacterium]